MQHKSRWIPAVAALILTAACSDSPPATAPVVSAGVAAELSSTACGAELDALRSAIADADFIGKSAAKEESSLQLKVDAVQVKLAEGKTADSIQKLEDIRATVLALGTAAKPKLDATDAAAINAAVDAAEACIQALAVAGTF